MPFAPKRHKQPNPQAQREARERYDAKRGTASERGYDSSWRITRQQHIQDHPLCEMCLQEGKYVPMQELHHIKKLADFPGLRDVSSNLMSLCKSHHSQLTAKGH